MYFWNMRPTTEGRRQTEGGRMAGVETRDFSAPDETRTPEKTTVEL